MQKVIPKCELYWTTANGINITRAEAGDKVKLKFSPVCTEAAYSGDIYYTETFIFDWLNPDTLVKSLTGISPFTGYAWTAPTKEGKYYFKTKVSKIKSNVLTVVAQTTISSG